MFNNMGGSSTLPERQAVQARPERGWEVVAESAANTNGSMQARGAERGTHLHRRPAVRPCPAWKRSMDITCSVVLLAMLLPVFVVIAAGIKCVSRGPVFYRQRRYGLGGRPFRVWKFRTVEIGEAEGRHVSHVTDLMLSNGKLQKRDDELRLIFGGRLLRKLGVDELPQLINVLRGEMSLVGPRPDVVPYQKYAERYKRRFDVLPGITGLWQVKGKNRTTFNKMMQLDLAYVRRRSLWLDLGILLMTIPALAAE